MRANDGWLSGQRVGSSRNTFRNACVESMKQVLRTTHNRGASIMSIQSFLWVAIALFAIAAGGGLVMAGVRAVGDRNPPAWLAMLHGLLASAGLTLLLFAAFTVGLPK